MQLSSKSKYNMNLLKTKQLYTNVVKQKMNLIFEKTRKSQQLFQSCGSFLYFPLSRRFSFGFNLLQNNISGQSAGFQFAFVYSRPPTCR